jgi:hypothetical protein
VYLTLFSKIRYLKMYLGFFYINILLVRSFYIEKMSKKKKRAPTILKLRISNLCW